MKRASLLIAGAAVIICVFLFWPTDEKRIAMNLNALAEYCSSPATESVIDTVKKVAMAAKLFADPFDVRIESMQVDRTLNKKELSDSILMVRKRLPDTTFSFADTTVTMTGKLSASVITTLRLETMTGDERLTDAYELQAEAEKQEGEWLFTSFTVLDFIRK